MDAHPQILILVGLPASGKSERMDAACAADPTLEPFDDFLSDWKRANGEQGLLQMFRLIREGRRIICNEVFLCRAETRELFASFLEAAKPGIGVGWSWFENAPEACLENARRAYEAASPGPHREQRRKDRRALIEDLSKDYSPPAGCKLEPVYRG